MKTGQTPDILAFLVQQDSAVSPEKSADIPFSVANLLKAPAEQPRAHSQSPKPANPARALYQDLFTIFREDVVRSHGRLGALNPGRRLGIERRLETIARVIARFRGERFQRTLSLESVLQEAEGEGKTVSRLAWEGFITEVALYHLLELFALKGLDKRGLRTLTHNDLGRMNFALHSYFNQSACGFSSDRHCWNFVRTNLYSWHVPSQQATEEVIQLLDKAGNAAWNDLELREFGAELTSHGWAPHLDIGRDHKIAAETVRFLKERLGFSFTEVFQDTHAIRKTFLPTLDAGALAQEILETVRSEARLSTDFSKAVWACDPESFEVFWTEVNTLLMTLRWSSESANLLRSSFEPSSCSIPRLVNVIQGQGLELHNLDQLPLGMSRQQGTANRLQQMECFDCAIVTDHPDRMKTGRWLSALSAQLPYWRSLISTGSNLNWGELHLYLGLSKLKENGLCLYLSHRVLPDGGDGERFRKTVLSQACLELFAEIENDAFAPYRYLYVFRKRGDRTARETHRPCFGKITSTETPFESSPSTQAEIMERGWNQIFSRVSLPLVRHLNGKFPKLFQIASIQPWANRRANCNNSDDNAGTGLFADESKKPIPAIEIVPQGPAFRILEPNGVNRLSKDSLLVFPHNPSDLSWLSAMLSSPPVRFWIENQVQGASQRDLKELRSVPIVDLTRALPAFVDEAMAWLAVAKPDEARLMEWCLEASQELAVRQARYVALSKKRAILEALMERYRPMFQNSTWIERDDVPELDPNSVSKFYPRRLLVSLGQSPDVRIQMQGREKTAVTPEHWMIASTQSAMNGITVEFRQGPKILIQLPRGAQKHLLSQLLRLIDHTWGEALELLRTPQDTALFANQSTEIIRMVVQTAAEARSLKRALDALSLDLFEIPADVRAPLLVN